MVRPSDILAVHFHRDVVQRLVGELRTALENSGNMTPEADELITKIEERQSVTDALVTDMGGGEGGEGGTEGPTT